MEKEIIFTLEKKFGFNKNNLNDILKDGTSSDKTVPFASISDLYKSGTMYGTISVNDF
jgi:hypothetical protein